MKKYHKLKVCLIKAGEVTTELPDNFLFENLVLEGLSQGLTHQLYTQLFSNGEVFSIAWMNQDEGKNHFDPRHFPRFNPLLIAQLSDEKNWFVMDFMFEVQLKHLKNVVMK